MVLSYKQEAKRKLIHLSSFWMVGAIYLLPNSWAIMLFSFFAAFVLVSEYFAFKKNNTFFARSFNTLFKPVLREKEKKKFFRFSGAPYVLIAALILVIFCDKYVCMFAMSVLLISDTMAALIGKMFGKHHLFEHKTIEGTAAFIVSGLCVAYIFNIYFGLSMGLCAVGVFLGCVGDLLNETIHVDDNLSIPLLTALPFLLI